MTTSRRCVDCDENWPVGAGYVRCPECGETTVFEYRHAPMQFAEAEERRIPLELARQKQKDFAAFCVARDKRLACERDEAFNLIVSSSEFDELRRLTASSA